MVHFPASLSVSRLAGSSGTLEQDWRQALEQKSRAPPARPRGDITSQFHSVPGGKSVSDIQVRTLRTVADARSNDPVRSQASSGKTNQSDRPQLKLSGGVPRVPADRDDRHRPVQHRRVAALLAGGSLVGLVGRARQ